jgi:hypothetical protein
LKTGSLNSQLIANHLRLQMAVMIFDDLDTGAHIFRQRIDADALLQALRGVVMAEGISVTFLAAV